MGVDDQGHKPQTTTPRNRQEEGPAMNEATTTTSRTAAPVCRAYPGRPAHDWTRQPGRTYVTCLWCDVIKTPTTHQTRV